MQRDDSVEQSPDGISHLAYFNQRGEFASIDAVLKNFFYDVDGPVRHLDDVIVGVIRKVHMLRMKHEGHENPEKLPVVEEKIYVNVAKLLNDRRSRIAGQFQPGELEIP